METWCLLSNSVIWGGCSCASLHIVQWERLPPWQEHRSCACFIPFIRNAPVASRHIPVTYHGCRAQEPAEASSTAGAEVTGIPCIIACSFSEQQIHRADTLCTSGCSPPACSRPWHRHRHPSAAVPPASPPFCFHPMTDTEQQKSKGDSVLYTCKS